jgi:hypothetical protein
MTGGSQAGAIPAMQALQLDVAVVQCIGEMRGGAAGLAASHCAIFQHDDPLARLCQQVCR